MSIFRKNKCYFFIKTLRKRMTEKIREVKVVILGDVGVGKSTVAHRMSLGHLVPNLSPTIAAGYVCIPKGNLKLNIWDSSGSERFNRLLPMYVRGAKIIILEYDLTRPETVDKLINYRAHFIEELPETAESTWIVVGNKSDLFDSNSKSSISGGASARTSEAWRRAEKFATDNTTEKMQHFVVSAYSGQNIAVLLENLLSTAEDACRKSVPKDTGVIQLMPFPEPSTTTTRFGALEFITTNLKQRFSSTSNCCS